MKTYRIQFADAQPFLTILVITILSFTIIGIPYAIALLPTLYKIVEKDSTLP